jgi:hypothetical protein
MERTDQISLKHRNTLRGNVLCADCVLFIEWESRGTMEWQHHTSSIYIYPANHLTGYQT